MALGWLLEFILEASGAILYRRKNNLLCFILAFCAVTDFAGAALRMHYSKTAIYGWYAWSQFAFKELFLIWLACAICGMFVAEKDRSRAYISAAFISLATCAMVTVFAFQAETLKDRMLDGVISANIVMLAIVFVAWIGRRQFLSDGWKVITIGFAALIGGDFLVTVLWKFWDGAQYWQQLPTIAAYLIWVAGPMRTVRLGEFRVSLEKKFPQVEKVRVC
jgi:hypothetical protein